MPNSSIDATSYIGRAPSAITIQSDDLEAASKSLTTEHRAILEVIDASFDGSLPRVQAKLSSDDDIEEGLHNLPAHESGTARILDVTVHSDFVATGLRYTKGPKTTELARNKLIEFLKDTYKQLFEERQLFRWLSDPVVANDIGSISSQWSQRLSSGTSGLSRVVNRSSLQQHPFDYDVRPRDSYMTCAQDTDDRLVVIIVHEVWERQTFGSKKTFKPKKGRQSNRNEMNDPNDDGKIHFRNPRCTSNMLAGTSLTSLSDGTLEKFTRLLLLDFFLASIYLQPVDHYRALIYPTMSEEDVVRFSLTKNPHLQVPLGLFEPRLSTKSSDAFKEIVDAESIFRNVVNVKESVNFVAKGLRNARHAAADKPALDVRMQEGEDICEERSNNADRALHALNRQLDYLTKRHAIREAKAIRILTILASLYLPLSLSASALSMQNPFKAIVYTRHGDQSPDLEGTNLLFDFFGVFIGLAVFTLFAVQGIGLALRVRTNGLGLFSQSLSDQFSIFQYGSRWRFGGRGGKIFKVLRRMTVWWICAMFCITFLTIFMKGMLTGAQAAWDTARWMFLIYIVVSVLLLSSCIVLYKWLYLKKLQGWSFRWSVSSWSAFFRW